MKVPDIEWEVVNVTDDKVVAWFTHKSDAELFSATVALHFGDCVFKVRRYKAGRF